MSSLPTTFSRKIGLTILLLCSSFLLHGQATQPSSPSPGRTLEQRVDLVDEHVKHLDDLVKANSETSRFFITLLSVVIGVIVGVQSIFQGLILRHQWARETERDRRESDKESPSNTGAKAVADVLNVVKDTMNTRLIQEKSAQKEAAKAKEEVQKIQGALDRMVIHFERVAQTAHDRIESLALQLAKVRRHDFKERPDQLSDFAQRHDEYVTDLQPLARADLTLSARIMYVRGIAAHYTSDPASAKRYLTDAAGRNQPETGETELEHSRRRANAYYYLGVNESNFANYTDALQLFERANSLDLDNRDLLTRIAMAECYIFDGQLDRALQFIGSEIDARIEDLKTRGDFRSYHVPLKTRTELLKVNVAVLASIDDWPARVQALLEPACVRDPDSYFASSSLAQAYEFVNDERAKQQFDAAYESIIRRGHLETTTELRSRVLLLMVAGMCSQKGSDGTKKRMPEEFLEEAKTLLERLPRRDSEECTVFSPVSKRNETATTIASHIGQIELGSVIQPRRKIPAAA
jgi:tetratricopeptide (TPR) repeat protein